MVPLKSIPYPETHRSVTFQFTFDPHLGTRGWQGRSGGQGGDKLLVKIGSPKNPTHLFPKLAQAAEKNWVRTWSRTSPETIGTFRCCWCSTPFRPNISVFQLFFVEANSETRLPTFLPGDSNGTFCGLAIDPEGRNGRDS